MREARVTAGGRWRWVGLLLPVLSLGLMGYSLYAWASDSLDEMRRNSLSLLALLALLLSTAPPDVGVLTWARAAVLWRARDGRRAVLAVGLQLLMVSFALGAGLALLFNLLAPLSGFVYFIALVLLMLDGLLAFLRLAVPGLPSSAAGR